MVLLDEEKRMTMFPFMKPDAPMRKGERPFERAEYNKATGLLDLYFEGGLVVTMSAAECVGWVLGLSNLLAQIGSIPQPPTLHLPGAPAPDDPVGGL